MEEHLRFSPRILSRLGEELIPDPDQGIIELVRNSYDADAGYCTVKLSNTDKLGGTVHLSDNGLGMTGVAIREGWLVLGRSSKSAQVPTKKGRLPVGDKGLGRLAALRLGDSVSLATRPKAEPGVEYRLTIDWSEFDNANVIEDVKLNVEKEKTTKSHGTDLILKNLKHSLGRKEVERLAKALVLLSDPFDNETGFRADLYAPGSPDLEKKVKNSYLDEAEYQLIATVDDNGKATASVTDWKGKKLWTAKHSELSEDGKPYVTPAARFEVWIFNLGSSEKFTTRKVPLTELRDWLKVFGSIHLYHRNLRVRPYGDPGHDWLELNLSRVKSPELRPSTNNSVGRVFVLDEHEQLLQKTDRVGFIENEPFHELKRFAVDALDWLAEKRMEQRESNRIKNKTAVAKGTKKAKKTLDDIIRDKVPKKTAGAVKDAVEMYVKSFEKEAKVLREDLQLYRTLATAGTTAAVFAHESGKPIANIVSVTKIISDRAQKLLAADYAMSFEKPIGIIMRSAEVLKSFALLPLHFLKREKRKSGNIDLHAVINELLLFFDSFLKDAKITIKKELIEDTQPKIRGSTALVEAIVANFLTNSINAFSSPSSPGGDRIVVIRTEVSGNSVLLKVLDNGPGITEISVDDIFLPGRSSTPGGTGLGLTIVRDVVSDLEGTVHAMAKGELGGAEFTVQLPILKEEK